MFAVCGADFTVLPASAILESLERNGQAQAKGNLAVGPVFREIADSFRDWSKVAEPGCFFQAPEISLRIVRLASCPPLSTAFSESARKKLAEQQEPIPNDRLKIALD